MRYSQDVQLCSSALLLSPPPPSTNSSFSSSEGSGNSSRTGLGCIYSPSLPAVSSLSTKSVEISSKNQVFGFSLCLQSPLPLLSFTPHVCTGSVSSSFCRQLPALSVCLHRQLGLMVALYPLDCVYGSVRTHIRVLNVVLVWVVACVFPTAPGCC